MSSVSTSNLFGSGTGKTESTTEKSKRIQPGGALGQDQFLKLLTAQLQHQDPLEPQASAEFIAQLATFSTLEKLTSIEGLLKKSLGMDVAAEK